MSEGAEQKMLLNAIECLKGQYRLMQSPCVALMISRQYRLLANLTGNGPRRESYSGSAKAWLRLYVSHENHPLKLQNRLADFVSFYNPS